MLESEFGMLKKMQTSRNYFHTIKLIPCHLVNFKVDNRVNIT